MYIHVHVPSDQIRDKMCRPFLTWFMPILMSSFTNVCTVYINFVQWLPVFRVTKCNLRDKFNHVPKDLFRVNRVFLVNRVWVIRGSKYCFCKILSIAQKICLSYQSFRVIRVRVNRTRLYKKTHFKSFLYCEYFSEIWQFISYFRICTLRIIKESYF